MPNFSDIFPTLRIDPKDVSGSWKRFLEKFNIAIRFEVCNKGMKKVVINDVEQDVNVFDDELKLCALLKAVSNEGFEVLYAQGIDIHSEELNYDQVLQALKNAYAREESLNVKLWNFNSARQQSGEDSRDFLRRVEHLSRTTGIFQASTTGLDDGQKTAVNNELERIRQTMAQVVVVNGLKDLQLRLELMAMHDLNWEKLCRILSSRSSAAESELKLDRPTQVPNPVKQEVASSHSSHYHQSKNRHSKSRRCYECGSYSHKYADCQYIVCFHCKEKGHTTKNCRELSSKDRLSYRTGN